jgi:hypothetical protein
MPADVRRRICCLSDYRLCELVAILALQLHTGRTIKPVEQPIGQRMRRRMRRLLSALEREESRRRTEQVSNFWR